MSSSSAQIICPQWAPAARPSGLQRSLCVLKTSVEVGHVLERLAYERFGYIAGLGNISSDDNEPAIVVFHAQSSIVLRPFHFPYVLSLLHAASRDVSVLRLPPTAKAFGFADLDWASALIVCC